MNAEYTDFVQKAASRRELALLTCEFLEKAGSAPAALLQHQHRPDALTVLYAHDRAFSVENWSARLKKDGLASLKDFISSNTDYFSFVGSPPPYRKPFYIFVFTDRPSREIIELLHIWLHLDTLIGKTESNLAENLSVEWANLVSQLLHDTSSLIQLASQNEMSAELQKRLQYQTHVQDNLLFYIRPVEIIRAPLPVKDLIIHSLQMSNFDYKNFSLMISEKVTDIVIDAETFAKAFNEVVRNAMTAVEQRPDKISISVDREEGRSPFLTYDWLKIAVHDQGKGIIPDFLDYICEPFFTTRKSEGHSGFGLTIAKKIIEAHEGQLIIDSVAEEGTTVTFYLPVLTSDTYE